jgi:hypothetical protein
MVANQEAIGIGMSPRDHSSGSKPRMHNFEAVLWISCSRFKRCAVVPDSSCRHLAYEGLCAFTAASVISGLHHRYTRNTKLIVHEARFAGFSATQVRGVYSYSPHRLLARSSMSAFGAARTWAAALSDYLRRY